MKTNILQIIGLSIILGTLSVSAPSIALAKEVSVNAEMKEMKEALSVDIESIHNAIAGVDYSENEIIILCDSPEEAQEIADKYYEETGVTLLVKEYSYGVAVLEIEDTNNMTVEDIVIASSDADNDLNPAYPNFYAELCSLEAGESRLIYTDNEHFTDPFTKNDSPNYQYYHEMIDTKYIWDALENDRIVTSEGKSMREELSNTVVAVIDTGINTIGYDFHEADVDGNMSGTTDSIIVGGHCFISSLGEDNVEDGHGHGSNVAGIIADTANNLNGRGIASGVKIMPLRVFNESGGGGSTSYSVAAINYAVKSRQLYDSGVAEGELIDGVPAYNVKVINMSLGGFSASSLYLPVIKMAKEAGVIICAAAGNYSTEAQFYPAAYPGVVSVAAVNRDYEKSDFSDYGDTIDIAAPGGENSLDARYRGNSSSYSRTEELYASGIKGEMTNTGKHGTSQATPVVSAVAALAMTKYPDKSVDDIVMLLKETASPVVSDGIGSGCVNAAKTLGIDVKTDMPDAMIMHAVNDEHPEEGTEGIAASLQNEMNRKNGIHFLAHQDAVIFYTVNGNEPDPFDMEGSETYIYDGAEDTPESWILYGYDGDKRKITIKAKSLVYGRLSETLTIDALFGLNRVERLSLYAKSGALSGPNSAKISVGNSISLGTMIYPENAENKNVVWESSDTSSVTVTDKGVITVIAAKGDNESPTPVCITAKAADGYGASADFYVVAVPSVSNIEIAMPGIDTKMYSPDTILLEKYGDQYDLSLISENIKVWPENALQKVIYASSNNKVVSVSSDGIVTASGSGIATVTVMAADGSGKKDTQKFKVVNPIYAMKILDKNKTSSANHLIAEGMLAPEVIFNNGESVPDNTSLTWSFTNSVYNNYATINKRTGVVTAKSNDYIKSNYTIQIEAYSLEYDMSAKYSFELHPKITSLKGKTEPDRTGMYVKTLSRSASEYIKNLVGVNPISGTYDDILVSTSDSSIVAVSSGGYSACKIKALNIGECYIDVKAMDGSNASLRIKVVVTNNHTYTSSTGKIGVVFENGDNIFYPGKKLPVSYDTNYSVEISYVAWSLPANEKYVTVSDGYVISKSDAEELTEYNEEILTVTGVKESSIGSSVSAKGSALIRMFPARTSDVIVSKAVSESGEDVYRNKVINIDSIGATVALQAVSVPNNSCQDSYKYVSSNPSVVKVDANGNITSIKTGTAKITVYAGDNGGAKTTVDVKVNNTKAISVICPIKEVNLSTVETADVKCTAEISSERIIVLPAKAMQKVEVSSSNKSVVDIEIKEKNKSNEPDVYVIRAVGNGRANIKITTVDGSRKTASIKVLVSTPITAMNIKSGNSSFILKPGKSLKLTAGVNSNATSKKVSWEFTDKSMSNYASINASSGVVNAYNDRVDESEHIVSVRARALDYGGYISEPMNIVISPSVVKMKNIQVKSKSNIYDLAYGSSLPMIATTTVDATNKKISWSVSDASLANISTSGVLKVKAPLTEKKTVTVTATALDGSEVSGSCAVNLYPKMDKIVVMGPKEMFAVEEITLNIAGLNNIGEYEGSGAPRQKFSVMYTTGAGKVYLNNSDGTSIKVKGIKKGTVTVTVTALDGSNKKVRYPIKVK